MERLTHKIVYDNEHYQYVFDYNQDVEVGTKLGELEDVLEEFEFTSAKELRNHLNFQDNMAIWEGELNYKNKIAELETELAELKQKAIVLEKAFELACDPRDDWGGERYSGTEFNNYHDYFIAEAEQKLAEIKGEK